MTYEEMLEATVSMGEAERRQAFKQHWQAVFSDGFVAYVQGQVEAGQQMVHSEGPISDLLNIGGLKQLVNDRAEQLTAVWDSMRNVYAEVQHASEQQGNSGGMVGHSQHTAMPKGLNVSQAVRCYRCGAPVSVQGLCSGCIDAQQDWQQDDLDYDRQLQDQQLDRLDHQRLQADQQYYDNQADYNTYTDYGSSYTPDYSSDY